MSNHAAPALSANSPANSRATPRLKLRAPELTGRRWINTGGQNLTLDDLRGKIVLVDFWTFCCINCLHVLDELRPLEEKYADILVTIGVHSPKFEFEREIEAVDRAVERYQVEHIVLDDPNLDTWNAYTARAWPTLAVIDPEGYLVASMSGEGHTAGLTSLIEDLAATHQAKGTLRRGNAPYVAPEPTAGDLHYPGKLIRLTTGQILVADSGHHSYAILNATGTQVIDRIGSGTRGFTDGSFETAQFSEPGGLTELPAELAAQVGYHLVAADTVNHALRGINLETRTVTTLAGTGEQYMVGASDNVPAQPGFTGRYDGPGAGIKLSSPWDVVFSPSTAEVVVAMAGNHTIWSFNPVTSNIAHIAGSLNEGLRDTPAGSPAHSLDEWFAQPSGVRLTREGDVWVADSETSALRKLDPATGAVTTHLGVGLFDFGFQDGPASEARLQHPLGALELPDGSVAIADTYNGAIRRYDPASKTVSTLARGLKEPSDMIVVDSDDPEEHSFLLVAESAAHQLVAVPIPEEALTVNEGAQQTKRPVTPIGLGALDISVQFSVPTGQKLDDRWGDPTYLQVSSTPPELITSGDGGSEGLTRSLTLNPAISRGVLHVTARAAACDGEPGGEIPLHAACHLYQQDWGIPVEVVDGESTELTLDLRGV